MTPFRLILFAAFCVSAAAQANETFKIDPSRSTIAFKVRHMLGSAKGSFSKFNGTIEVDRDHPEQSSVTVTIAAASIDTRIAKRDEHLRGELFNVAKYPEITFKTRRVKQTGPHQAEVSGDLTMHGVTRGITLHVESTAPVDATFRNERSRWRVSAEPIKRNEFGLVWNSGVEAVSMIGNDVTLDIQIEAVRSK